MLEKGDVSRIDCLKNLSNGPQYLLGTWYELTVPSFEGSLIFSQNNSLYLIPFNNV